MTAIRFALICLGLLLAVDSPSLVRATEPAAVIESDRLSEAVHKRAVETLRSGLADAEGWTKVHAAEFLLQLELPRGVGDAFEAERRRHGQESPYRIGIWRVLAKTEPTAAERRRHVDRLIEAAVDPNGPDRLHAIETLAKLGERLQPKDAAVVAKWAAEATAEQAAFADWLLSFCTASQQHRRDTEARLAAGLEGTPLTRLRAAVAIAGLPERTDATEAALIAAADRAAAGKPATGLPRLADAYLIASAWRVASSGDKARPETDAEMPDQTRLYHRTLRRWAESGSDVAVVFANALAGCGAFADAAWLADQLDHEDPEVRLSAAHALLQIDRRRGGFVTAAD